MKHKEKCYKALFSILKAFTSFSGLKVNYNKTEILRIGSLRNTNARYYSELPLFWTDGPIKILGIWVLANRNEMLNRNWSDTMNKAENILRLWRRRSLTLLGNIMIINTLVLPLFVYRLAIILTPSDLQFQQYKKLILDFLWEGKKPKIANSRLTSNYIQGGLKLVDLETKDLSLKVKWFKLINSN